MVVGVSSHFPVNFQVVTDNINHDKDVVVQKLRNTAVEDESCGQVLVVEREKTLAPKRNYHLCHCNQHCLVQWPFGLLWTIRSQWQHGKKAC